MEIKGAKILITGGSRGLGKATAKLLKEAGAEILITGRDKNQIETVTKELGIHGLAADVANEAGIQKTFDWLDHNWGGQLDVLVNNAGIGSFPTLEEVTMAEMEKVFRVNVFGAALMAKGAAERMKKSGGSIINISSSAGRRGFARGTVYAASKFALSGMTESWRAELRPHNIRVMQVNPSEVPTAFNQEGRAERPLEDKKLTPREIAHAIKSMLEMDNRGFITELSVWATNPF